MKDLKRFFIGLSILLVLPGCSKESSKIFRQSRIKEAGINNALIRNENFSINFSKEQVTDSITLKYLGSGGFYLANGHAGLLIDPFFSPYKVFPLALRKISTQPENVTIGLQDIKTDIYNNVEAIFITHSHYDHLLDTPYVFHHCLNSDSSKIYGSSSMKSIVSAVVDTSRLVNIESKSGSIELRGEWIYLNESSIRVMPIKTEHAPHLKKLVSVCLYDGEAELIQDYNSDSTKTFVTRWKGGNTFAYLIDFMKDGEPEFRIYLLSSASSPPDGFIDQETLAEHKINLAILGAASFANVENYPQGILAHLRPEKLLIAHWEDLFKPYLHDPPRLIRATNFNKLIPQIDRVYPWQKNNEQQFFMPAPGVLVSLKY
jgi:hypothetical protein